MQVEQAEGHGGGAGGGGGGGGGGGAVEASLALAAVAVAVAAAGGAGRGAGLPHFAYGFCLDVAHPRGLRVRPILPSKGETPTGDVDRKTARHCRSEPPGGGTEPIL